MMHYFGLCNSYVEQKTRKSYQYRQSVTLLGRDCRQNKSEKLSLNSTICLYLHQFEGVFPGLRWIGQAEIHCLLARNIIIVDNHSSLTTFLLRTALGIALHSTPRPHDGGAMCTFRAAFLRPAPVETVATKLHLSFRRVRHDL